MIAFASNSLLCRAALKHTAIDPATFTSIRILSGAIILWLIVRFRRGNWTPAGTWPSALALFAYAAAFSFAYNALSAGTGALLLFGAVQATMILWGLHKGERLGLRQTIGLIIALVGLVTLVFPGLSAPPIFGSILMLGAGLAWGIYSLRGKGGIDPIAATASNFIRALPLSALVSLLFISGARFDQVGILYAIVSGGLTSGLGYVMWYTVLPQLKATSAATVQLSVPVLAASGGILLLGEPITFRYSLASIAVLGGIALVMIKKTGGHGLNISKRKTANKSR